MLRRAALLGLALAACGAPPLRSVPDPDLVTCGAGTRYDVDAGTCVVAITCGPGTVLEEGVCRVTDAGQPVEDAGTSADAGATLDAGAMDAGLSTDAGSGPTACEGPGSALFFDGSGFIFNGTQVVTQGTFATTATTQRVEVHVTPASSSQGLSWDADFAAPALDPVLTVKAYPTATRYPFQAAGEAGLAVTGNGRGCNQSSGHFEVLELERDDAGVLTRFHATFTQLCENQPSNRLSGCVRYVR